MARRRRRTSWDTPTKKRPISDSDMASITSRVSNMFNQLAGKDPHGMTREEIIHMWVAPEHRAAFLDEDVMALGWGTPMNFEVAGLTFQMDRAPVPAKPVWQVDFPERRAEEHNAWVERRIHLIKEFSLLDYTITKLNELCSSQAEIRYFLPGIQVLLSSVPHKGVTSPVALPPEVKDLCRRASTLIATTQLLSYDYEPEPSITLTVDKFTWVEAGVGEVRSIVG